MLTCHDTNPNTAVHKGKITQYVFSSTLIPSILGWHLIMERTILLPETEAQQCLDCRGRRKPEGVVLLREVVVFPWTRRMRRITTSNFFFWGKNQKTGRRNLVNKVFNDIFLSYTFLSCQDLAKHFSASLFWGYMIKTVPLK